MEAVRSVVLPVLTSLAAATLPPLHAQTPYVEVSDGIGNLHGVSTVSPYNIYGIWESGSNTYGTWVP